VVLETLEVVEIIKGEHKERKMEGENLEPHQHKLLAKNNPAKETEEVRGGKPKDINRRVCVCVCVASQERRGGEELNG
jgi:hypothetical protein